MRKGEDNKDLCEILSVLFIFLHSSMISKNNTSIDILLYLRVDLDTTEEGDSTLGTGSTCIDD